MELGHKRKAVCLDLKNGNRRNFKEEIELNEEILIKMPGTHPGFQLIFFSVRLWITEVRKNSNMSDTPCRNLYQGLMNVKMDREKNGYRQRWLLQVDRWIERKINRQKKRRWGTQFFFPETLGHILLQFLKWENKCKYCISFYLCVRWQN